MERSRRFFCMVGLMAFCLAGHAFVSSRFGSSRQPARAGHDMEPGNAFKLFDDASDLFWSATGQALSVGAALGMVFALTQASVRAEQMPTFADLESQVTVAAAPKIDKEKKVKELKADAKKVDEFTKNKVRTSEEKFREFTKDFDTEMSSTERFIRAGPGVRSVVRKSLQKAKPAGPVFTGFEGLPALPALPSISLPGLPGPGGDGSGGAPAATEDAALGVLSGAAISLGVPAVVVAGAVNNRIQEKKREDAERRAREAADVTGPILTAVAGVGAAVLVGNAILTNLPEAEEFVEEAETEAVDTTASQKAAAEAAAKAAAQKAAVEKAAAAKAAADKAAAEKAASQASADKAAAEKAAAEKASADKAAADKAAAEKAAADKAAADKAAADKAAAEKAAAEKAAAQKAAEKPAEKVKPAAAEESSVSKILSNARKG